MHLRVGALACRAMRARCIGDAGAIGVQMGSTRALLDDTGAQVRTGDLQGRTLGRRKTAAGCVELLAWRAGLGHAGFSIRTQDLAGRAARIVRLQLLARAALRRLRQRGFWRYLLRGSVWLDDRDECANRAWTCRRAGLPAAIAEQGRERLHRNQVAVGCRRNIAQSGAFEFLTDHPGDIQRAHPIAGSGDHIDDKRAICRPARADRATSGNFELVIGKADRICVRRAENSLPQRAEPGFIPIAEVGTGGAGFDSCFLAPRIELDQKGRRPGCDRCSCCSREARWLPGCR